MKANFWVSETSKTEYGTKDGKHVLLRIDSGRQEEAYEVCALDLMPEDIISFDGKDALAVDYSYAGNRELLFRIVLKDTEGNASKPGERMWYVVEREGQALMYHASGGYVSVRPQEKGRLYVLTEDMETEGVGLSQISGVGCSFLVAADTQAELEIFSVQSIANEITEEMSKRQLGGRITDGNWQQIESETLESSRTAKLEMPFFAESRIVSAARGILLLVLTVFLALFVSVKFYIYKKEKEKERGREDGS